MGGNQFFSIEDLQNRIAEARSNKTPLRIAGNASKAFYGNSIDGEPLGINLEPAIVEYEPTELFITATASTPLSVLRKELQAHGQQLAFDPPDYNGCSTAGGMLSSGLSGSRRPFAGAIRDHTLGVDCIDGRGERLSFGGRVMKNVAGYDAGRLMVGAMGTLGVITHATFKVAPKPSYEKSVKLERDNPQSMDQINKLRKSTLPLTALFADERYIYCRLSGCKTSVENGSLHLGDMPVENDESFWATIDTQTHDLFADERPLWRLSVPVSTPVLPIEGKQLVDWAGGVRWLFSNADGDSIRKSVATVSGHATLFRNTDRYKNNENTSIFQPLDIVNKAIQSKIKKTFDPDGILNPGIMYTET